MGDKKERGFIIKKMGGFFEALWSSSEPKQYVLEQCPTCHVGSEDPVTVKCLDETGCGYWKTLATIGTGKTPNEIKKMYWEEL